MKKYFEQSFKLLSGIDDLKAEMLKTKLTSLKDQLQIYMDNANHQRELIQNLHANDLGSTTDAEYHLTEIIKEARKGGKTINEIVELISSKKNFISDKSWIDTIKNFLEEWNKFLFSLSTEQLGAFAHIISALLILWCLFSIFIIVYSDFLIKYFKLEEKYPKLAKFIKIRRMFQHYYFFLIFY